MTAPVIAIDVIKSGIVTVNAIADEYAKSGLSSSTLIVAGKAVGVAAIAVALIPGKIADKALEPVVKKLDKVPSNKALAGTKATLMKKHNVACFKKNQKGSDIENDRQLQGQKDGINRMSVKGYLDNRESYKAIGRKSSGAAPAQAR